MHWFPIKQLMLLNSTMKIVSLFPLCLDSAWHLGHPDPLWAVKIFMGRLPASTITVRLVEPFSLLVGLIFISVFQLLVEFNLWWRS